MKKRELWVLILGLIVWVSFTSIAWAAMAALQEEATHALQLAMTRLGNPTDTQNMVCLTNAGYVMVQGEGTLTLCKTVRDSCD